MTDESKNEGRRYVDLWCVQLRGRHIYIEGNILSQDSGFSFDKMPYHSSKISSIKGPKLVAGASDREYVLEGKMVLRKTAFPDTFPNSEWMPQFIFESFLGGFPENWAALRDSWALLVEKQRASMKRRESSDKVQHLSIIGPLYSEPLACQNPMTGRLLEPSVQVDSKVQESLSPSLVKEGTTQDLEVKAERALEFTGGNVVAVDQVMQASPSEGHLELERCLASKPSQKRIKEEENVTDTMYGRLLEVEDEVMLGWLGSKTFAYGEQTEETGVLKENMCTEKISDSHATRKVESKFNINSVAIIHETVAKLDMGQMPNDVKNGVQMFDVKKKKRKVGVKKSKEDSFERLNVKVAVLSCEECGKTFSNNSKRILHINVVHRKIMPVKCEMDGCNRGFASRRDKEEHIRVVHNNNPFTCPVQNCAKIFASKTNCTAHVRMVHLKHRPYVCPYPECGVQVTRKFALEYHKRSVHGEPKLGCPVQGCRREFYLGWQLIGHMKDDHGAAA